MSSIKKLTLLFILIQIFCLATSAQSPNPKREFRGSWIQCVNGQFQGMSRDAMQSELTRQLNALQKCNINAVFFLACSSIPLLWHSATMHFRGSQYG